MKRLVIIDGKSVFYRGYYAMGALSTKDGVPTGGVYGFAAIAMELVKRLKPTQVVVAWDKAGTSIAKRKAIFASYKAGRVKPLEDFYAQIPLLIELVEALGWTFLECDNYEADDIIGTLAKQADETLDETGHCEYETYIISSDLDMLQIVDENTRMYRLMSGFSKIEEMDVAAVEEKYGISKNQFLDLKALKGDASDNIPGVPGVGEKTAVKLLNEYGSLEGIYQHINEISGVVGKKLVAGKQSALMSYELAKIMFDAPVQLDEVPEFKLEVEKVVAALEKLEFNSLIRKFQLQEKVERFEGEEVPSDAREKSEREKDEAKKAVSERLILAWDVKKMMHGDEEIARKILEGEEFWDLGQGKFLLDPLARKNEEAQLNLIDALEEENRERLRDEYRRQVREFEQNLKLYKVFTELDLPLIPVLYKMEKTGVKLDRKYFEQLKSKFGEELTVVEEKIFDLAGERFNVNSPVQLSGILFERLGLPTKGIKKTTRAYSTGAKELIKLEKMHPIVPLILEYREKAKLLNTYIEPLPNLADEQDLIHTTFTQNVTATGRLSSVGPNLQNIPVRTEEGKAIRRGFVAGAGKKLVSADYAQFELRLAAVLAGDEKLMRDFNAGVDIHTKTAAEVFGVKMEKVTTAQRRAAKVINFGVLYGMSAKGLADAAEMSFGAAKQFIEDYFALRRPIREYLDMILKQARELGYVETYFGRRRPTPDVKSANFIVRTGAERAAMNMPIQGTEADLMKRAMIKVQERLPETAKLILQVHDSLIVECEESIVEEVKKILRETMEGVAPELKVKLAVEVTVGNNWSEV